TAVTPPRRPPARARASYSYAEPPVRRRPLWPWLLAVLLVALAAVAGYYAYSKIQDSLSGSGSVSVPFLGGMREDRAVALLHSKGLTDEIHRRPNDHVEIGRVFAQSPDPGVRLDRGRAV